MKIARLIFYAFGFIGCLLLVSNCGKMSTGVCTGYSAEYNSTYCKDGWTQEECEEWDDIGVNGVSWTFHKGQTCEERGTPATQ
jgi:hypothetical protein